MNKHVNKVRKATGRAEAITAGRQQNKQQYLIIQLMKKKERIKTPVRLSWTWSCGGLVTNVNHVIPVSRLESPVSPDETNVTCILCSSWSLTKTSELLLTNACTSVSCSRCQRLSNRPEMAYVEEREAQLLLTNSRDALRGQSRSPNMVPFDMLGMVTYEGAIVTSSVRLSLIEIFDFKMWWPWNPG